MFNSNTGVPFTMNVVPEGNGGGYGGFGDGYGGWFWLIIIIVLFGGWGYGGYGTGGAQGAAANYTLASDFATLQRQLSDGFSSMERKGDTINAGLCDGFYANAQLISGVNTNIANAQSAVLTQMNNNAINAMKDTFAIQNGINGVNVNGNTNTQALLAQMNNNEAARQACCCATDNLISTNFGNLKYEMASQDCQIRQTVNEVGRNLADVQNGNTQAILAAIQGIKDDAKDEKIATLTAQLTAARNAADNAAQTAAIINELRPSPAPAYVVPNPYCNCGNTCNTCGC